MNRSALDVRGFGAVLYKEVRHVIRDRVNLILAIALPLVQVTLFGYALNTKVEHIATVVLNEDLGPSSIAFIDALRASRTFTVIAAVANRRALMQDMVSGRARVAFDIPPFFSADLQAGRRPQVQVSSTARTPRSRSLRTARRAPSIPACAARTFWSRGLLES